ncbi:MAG: riboflavin synthase [Patescibacteria group bacterium]
MFTGIIKTVSKVMDISLSDSGMVLSIENPIPEIAEGESISVNGVCSTVKKNNGALFFDYMPETLRKTNLKELQAGQMVNIEQSMKLSDRLDGHIVSGHIDCTGKIQSVTAEGNSFVYKITVLESKFMPLVAKKGSVSIDGISLTVVSAGEDFFTVSIIPYTQDHTNLKQKKIGDSVNLEFDMIAKYIQRIIKDQYADQK